MAELSEYIIRSSHQTYKVIIQPQTSLEKLEHHNSFIVCDKNVSNLYQSLCSDKAFKIEAIERNKTLNTVAQLAEELRSSGCDRQGSIIAIGGGIIQDIVSFTASSYMRGIPWEYYPTTLLGMADSCIGGKSSLNVGSYKNILGNFYPPRTVYIDPIFCQTLSDNQRIEGLCEAIKICYASGDSALRKFLEITTFSNYMIDTHSLSEIIKLSVSTKKVFIEEDEFDKGNRLLLNFGHTFGHAIESASSFKISHGIAVGIGMLISIAFSKQISLYKKPAKRVNDLSNYLKNLFKNNHELQKTLRLLKSELILKSFMSDKKHSRTEYTLITVNNEGYLERTTIPRDSRAQSMITTALQETFLELYEI